ncbi:MAG: hypothetical protein AB8D78_07985 [Akkermansiaceae bacterium]
MDFSAFLVPKMSNEKEKAELRPIDEEAEAKNNRLVRLNEYNVEEVDDEPAFKIGGKTDVAAKLEGASKEDRKTRSSDPNVGTLIEQVDGELDGSLEARWEREETIDRKIPKGWLWLLIVIFLIAVTWSLVQVASSEKEPEVSIAQPELIVEDDQDAIEIVDNIELTVRKFYDSRSVDEMVRYVRHPERVRVLMEDHYSRFPMKADRVEAISSIRPITVGKTADFFVMRTRLASSESDQLLIELGSGNEAKIDWETYVCYQPIDWDEFASERPNGFTGNFRVYAKRDHFFVHEFADSEKYACYQLTALGSDSFLFGYVERSSDSFEKIEAALGTSSSKSEPMLLRLHLPENLVSKRGLLIEKMLEPQWIYVEPPKSEEK